MKYRIAHQTAYHYSEPASLSQNELILNPRETTFQQVIHNQLTVSPEPQYRNARTDYFGNKIQVFMVQHPHTELTMTATSMVETHPSVGLSPEQTTPWEDVARQLAIHSQPMALDAFQFVFASPMVAISSIIQDYARVSFPPRRPVLEGGVDLMRRIFTEFTYDKSATTVDTRVDQVLAKRKGVCQDFAHLAISCLRSLGLAARYVSGYMETQPPPGKPKLVGADASHAWFSLFIPGIGWVDLDPTNNLMPGERHVTLAWGRDYGDVTPVKGVVMAGGRHALSVTVDVSAQDEVLRKP
jgi:transglutaminase-like putative cysteine protease